MDEDLFEVDRTAVLQAVEGLLDLRERPGAPVPADTPVGLPDEMPNEGVGAPAAVAMAGQIGIGQAVRVDHPGYFAHMDPPTPWPTWVTTMMAASVNQNLLHPDAGAAARALEQVVVGWLAPWFGMTGGHMVPGSTVANLTALWAARERAGVREVVASEAAHLSVAKSAHLLGLDYREVAVDDEQRLEVDELGALDHAALVLTAGTVATGAIDALDAGRTAAWRHVDAAWAGPLRLTEPHRDLLAGIEKADSVAMSAHKWLYQPKESALVLFADDQAAHDAISFGGGYLAAPNVGLLGSHGQGAALSLCATILALGRAGLAELIEADMDRADRLCELVAAHPDLRLRRPHVTGVVNFNVAGVDPRHVQQHLADAWVSITDISGTPWLRSVAANPHADPNAVVAAVLAAASVAKASAASRPARFSNFQSETF